MAGTGIEVEGAAQFASSLGRAKRDLEDLTDPNRRAAEMVLSRAQGRTPRDTGELAASGRVEADAGEGAVVYDAEYAGVIHNGWGDRNIEPQPWLADTWAESTADATDVYVDYADDLLHRVRGA